MLCDGPPNAETVKLLLQASERLGETPFNEQTQMVLDTLASSWTHVTPTAGIYETLASAQARSGMLRWVCACVCACVLQLGPILSATDFHLQHIC